MMCISRPLVFACRALLVHCALLVHRAFVVNCALLLGLGPACSTKKDQAGRSDAGISPAVNSPPRPEPSLEAATASDAGMVEVQSPCTLSQCGYDGCKDVAAVGSCEEPIPAVVWRRSLGGQFEVTLSGNTECGQSLSGDSECGTEADGLVFDLDLREAGETLLLVAQLDAEFDGLLRLDEGECADPVTFACNEDHSDGVERAVLSQEVEPGRYRLVVAPEAADDQGAFDLKLDVQELSPVCLEPPHNDSCPNAIELDPDATVQTVVGSTRCANNDAFSSFECGDLLAPDVAYRLDLSAREEPVLVRATTDLPPTNFDTTLSLMDSVQGNCFSVLKCNDDALEPSAASASDFASLVPPGEYFIIVDGYDLDSYGEFGLRVSLDEAPCGSNDVCEGAIELDPSLGEQSLLVQTACATSVRSSGCSESGVSHEVFYRLDLRAHEDPIHLRANADRYIGSYVSVFDAEDGQCSGVELQCNDNVLDTILLPGEYMLMVSFGPDEPPELPLEIRLEAVERGDLAACVDEELTECALYDDCCDAGVKGCLAAFSTCGLDPAVRDCVCDAQPGCCSNHTTLEQCMDTFTSCGVFCDDFDFVGYCEEAD